MSAEFSVSQRSYSPRIPLGIEEITDFLARMMSDAPNFNDESGYFFGRNIETTFFELNGGLTLIRKNLPEDSYERLVALSNEMRAHFEADLENNADGTLKGRALIHEMEILISTCKQSKMQTG